METRKISYCALILFCGVILAGSLFASELVIAAEKPKLTAWFYKSFVKDRNDIYEKQVKDFAKKKNIDADIYFFTDAEYLMKVTSAVVAGTPPDVCEFLKDGPARFHGMGELMDITDLVKAIDKELKFIPTFLLGATFGGRHYAAPKCHHPPMWFVRTDILKEAGAKEPETWEDVYEAAVKIRDKVKGIYPIGATYNRSTDADNFIFSCLPAYGAKVTEADGRTIVFDSPQTLAAAKMLEKLVEPGLQPPGVMGWTDPDNNAAWLAGKIAMTQNAASIYWKLIADKSPLLEHTKMLMMPAGPVRRATLGNALFLGIFKKSKNPKVAKELVQYLMKEENYLAWFEAAKGTAMPVSKKGMDLPYFTKDPSVMNEVKSTEITCLLGYPGPMTRSIAEVAASNIIPDMMVRIIVDKVPAEKAIKDATKAIEETYLKFGFK